MEAAAAAAAAAVAATSCSTSSTPISYGLTDIANNGSTNFQNFVSPRPKIGKVPIQSLILGVHGA